MRYIFLIAFCWSVFVAFPSAGQDTTRFAALLGRRVVRVSPFHLMNFYPTVQAGYEASLSARWAVFLEGGYVVPLPSAREFQDKRGFKAKVEPRYYFTVSRRANFFTYAGLEGYYNRVDFDREEWRTECFDLDCQSLYRRRYDYTMEYRESGAVVKYGFQWYPATRFAIDFNTGLGMRVIRYSHPPLIGEFDDGTDGWFEIPNEESRTVPSPFVGVRVGYDVTRRRSRK